MVVTFVCVSKYSDWREMKELYGFSISDFLNDIWSDPNDCKNECSLLVALLSSSLAGVLNGEAAGTTSTLV